MYIIIVEIIYIIKLKYKLNMFGDNYFDKWYIITLHDTDMIDISKNLKRAGVKEFEILRYTPAIKKKNTPKNASLYELLSHTTCDETAKNILDNHVATIRKAYSNKYNNVVILEDDARFQLPINKNKIKRVVDWLKRNYWEIFFFGHCPWMIPFSTFQTKDIVQPYSALLAHCYVLNRKGMYNVLKKIDRFFLSSLKIKQIDMVFSSSNMYKYAIFPSISYQNKAPAIYKSILKKIGIKLPYNSIFYMLELIAVLIPLLLFAIVMCILVKCC
jgi:hypothetical protein